MTLPLPTARPYKLSLTEKMKVREIINDLLQKGIVRESESEYASPIILVKKKDGSDRLCVDFRALNRVTVKERYPLPLIDDHIDRLGDKNIKRYSSLDMASGFHQKRIDPKSVHRTAFVTPEGHYEYLKMPYGLTNSPIVYQRIINKILRRFIETGKVLVYIDDVLLMSSTVDEGITLLREVFTTLTEAGFSINLRKCVFLTTEVEYPGRIISQGEVKPSPHKIKALVDSPAPENAKQVRQLLGLAGYFRKYIEGYATSCGEQPQFLCYIPRGHRLSLLRALEGGQLNREAQRELRRARATDLLRRNQSQQDGYVNRNRRPPRTFNTNDLVFVIKSSQVTGKLDHGMRGPYRRALPCLAEWAIRVTPKAGSYGKTTQAAAHGSSGTWYRGEGIGAPKPALHSLSISALLYVRSALLNAV